MSGDADSLARYLRWLGTPDCTCRSEWRALGVLYGVSMGHGWVRVSTDAACKYHGARGHEEGGGSS